MERRTLLKKAGKALVVTGTMMSTVNTQDENCADEPMTTGGQVAGACEEKNEKIDGPSGHVERAEPEPRGFIPGSPDDPSYESNEPEETDKTTGGEVA